MQLCGGYYPGGNFPEDHCSILLFTDTDSLMYETKTEDVYKILVKTKTYLILVIIELSQNF